LAQQRLDVLRRRGTVARNEVARRLGAMFTAPFDRRALTGVARGLDDLLASMSDAADQVARYAPKSVTAGVADQAAVLVRICGLFEARIARLGRRGEPEPLRATVRDLAAQAHAARGLHVRALFDGATDIRDVLAGRDIHRALDDAIAQTVPVGRDLDALAS
jgi:uncharacterized protein Yka (UPF0111/DUF47 family)